MKKVFYSTLVVFLISFGLNFDAMAADDSLDGCNNKTYYAADDADVWSIYNDFKNNCCKGSRVIIYNIETGEGGSYTLPSDGFNSKCEDYFTE